MNGAGHLLLVIDSGNTNVVFGLFDGDDLVQRWRCASDQKRTTDEYAVWLTQLMAIANIEPSDIGGAAIANVVPQALHHLENLCRRYFHCEPLVVDSHLDLGIEIRLDRPQDVGADRLVNAIAAHHCCSGWLIVVDFGTATTLDVVSPDGAYEGGIIAPGVNLSIEALERAAARLPRIAVARPSRIVGKDTIGAMRSGVYWGYIGLIEGLVARIKDEIGEPATVVATGGLARIFKGGTIVIDRLEPELTLTGLRLVHALRETGAA